MRFVAILLILSFALASPSFAEESVQADTQKIAEDLAGCGGVFSAISKTLKDLDKPAAALTYEDTARGAYLSAAYLRFAEKQIPVWENAISWAENQKEAQKNHWLALLELYQPTPEKAFPDDFMRRLDFCTRLNPIQTELVNMMRETVYSQGKK